MDMVMVWVLVFERGWESNGLDSPGFRTSRIGQAKARWTDGASSTRSRWMKECRI